jgi:hypothetical protein
MSAFNEHREILEHSEQRFGRDRGRLAVSLDRITNALVLVGQHGVYCTSQRNPALPAMDIRMVTQELTHAKELIQSVMEELRKSREASENVVAELQIGHATLSQKLSWKMPRGVNNNRAQLPY